MYDINLCKAEVIEIIDSYEDVTFLKVIDTDEDICKAVNYDMITGKISIGDQIVINTTAVQLSLGTGGYHFVLLNLDNGFQKKDIAVDENISAVESKQNGHIMKMRYTPLQLRTLSAEEEDSPYYDKIKKFQSLSNLPVIIIPLHSLLAPLVICHKHMYPDKKIVYIMSEGGSLALPFSNLVRKLKADNYLDKTITIGNAFGGDFEAVNIFTGLITASEVADADLIVVGIGPGIVGTSTKYGFSGVENSFVEKAVRTLGGKSIIVPRISFADKRKRHYGISHHTLTMLQDLITDPVEISFPDNEYIKEQVYSEKIIDKHDVYFYNIDEIKKILQDSSFRFNSMGRGFGDDPLFFLTAGLAVYRT
ncbi:MAG: DUF3866 family protein [Halanaerobiaceae bacterium]